MNEWQNKFWEPRAVVNYVMNKLRPEERAIKKIYFVEHLEGTPARCLRSTGECWLSLSHLRKMPAEYIAFILLHENEHVLQDSSDELKVDKGAHKKYLRMGFSLTKSVEALTNVLSYHNDEHYDRTVEQAVRATVYDITVNGNKKLLNKLIRSEKQRKTNRFN